MRYAKRGRARFTSHRDFCRAFERALVRAQIPMAYSSGFNPHPRISYANASSTGAATEAEYLEIGLATLCDPEVVREALDDALPPGLDVLAVAPATSQSLTELLQASLWEIDLVEGEPEVVAKAVDAFLACDVVEVTRMTKSGLRAFDARAAAIELSCLGGRRLSLLSLHGTPLVRPDDIVSGIKSVTPELATGQPSLITRIAQGPFCNGRIMDPLA